MNTTLKEVIYNMKNLKQAGRQSQDSLLSDAQYAFIIDYYRSKLIDQEYSRKKALAPQYEQTLNVKFQRQRAMEGNIGDNIKVFKGLNIPRVVMAVNRPYYTGVRASLLESSITRSTSTRIRNDLKSPHTGMSDRYFPQGDDLYLVSAEPIQELFVTAVFERPLDVWKLDPRFDPFDPYNFEYPITMRVLDTLYKMMREGEINMSMVTPNDLQADGIPEPVAQHVSNPRQATAQQQDQQDQ